MFVLNNRTFKKVTDINGTASISINLPVGEYNIDVIFKGDNNYINSSSNKNITVKTTIILPESKNYLLNTKYSVVLFDKDGNPLNNAEITVNIEGIDYKVSSDSNGNVSININLKPGNYEVSIINPLNGEKIADNIKVLPRIADNKNVVMYFGSGALYKVRVFADNGNPVGAGQIVTVKVNGKSSTLKTDKNGYAIYKIKLNPNKYTISASYKGYSVTNKITVKPVLTAKNIIKKKANKIIFSAKLVNTKGKALKGKKIIFKFKGKTYKIKTNKKGVAKLTLKKLKVGKYKITTKYGKSTIKNTIKIKK